MPKQHVLHVIHGSHPCVAVERALALKGQAWKVREIIAGSQGIVMRLRFGGPTVPAIRFASGEKLQGSMAIMRRLDELWPDPPLYPADPELRARADEAERWGDDELQGMTRRLLFTGFRNAPGSMHSYQEHAKIRFPRAVTRAAAPLVIAAEHRLHDITAERVARDVEQLPAAFDRVDAWIADGVLGTDQVTAADLQVAGSLRLLLTMADVRDVYGDRPAAALAHRLIPQFDGHQPAGTLVRG